MVVLQFGTFSFHRSSQVYKVLSRWIRAQALQTQAYTTFKSRLKLASTALELQVLDKISA